MAIKFNPLTGNFDFTGSGGGGGSSYIDGEVQNFSALPQTIGSPAVDSAYLVREAEGTWLLARKPAGIYIRTANTGVRANDWTHAGAFPDVFNDANFLLYDNGDSTKNLAFQLSGITTGTLRTLTVPDANITIENTGHAAKHHTGGSDAIFDQSLDKSDDVEFATVGIGDAPTGSARKFHQHGGKFTVESSSGSYGQFQVINPSAGEVSFVLANEAVANEDGTITSETTAQTWAFGTGSYGNSATTFVIGNNEGGSVFHVLPDGKVGLGSDNSDPAEALDVAGNIALRDIDNEFTATFDVQEQLSDDVVLTIPNASGTLALNPMTTAGDIVVGGTSGAPARLALGTASQQLRVNSGATGLEYFTPAAGGTKTLAVFTAEHNQPPATAFATLDTRNSIAVLDFDATTDESAVFVGIIPEGASLGSGLKVRLHWMASTATADNCRWGVQFEKSGTNVGVADSFDTAAEAHSAANGTSGIETVTEITITTIDSLAAGDRFRLKVFRNADDATNDTMTGDAELVAVEVRSAA